MTNTLLPSRFTERFTRLLLGVEPTDAARRQRVAHRLAMRVEPNPWADPLSDAQQRWLRARADGRIPLSSSWKQLTHHASGRYVLTYDAAQGTSVDIRILDPSERTVPRRLRIPLVSLGAPESVTLLDALPVGQRSRAPSLYPGAAYDISERVTALRGRVVVSGAAAIKTPVRWARVEARPVNGGTAVAWAHADHHGEFLLILPPESIPAPAVQMPAALTMAVTAHGRRGLPALVPPLLVQRADPFWDLPLETIGAPGIAPSADLVALGQSMPADYDGTHTQIVQFTYAETISSSLAALQIT